MALRVYSYGTGDELPGVPSDQLVNESFRRGEVGVVAAYEAAGVWHYLPFREADSTRFQCLSVFVAGCEVGKAVVRDDTSGEIFILPLTTPVDVPDRHDQRACVEYPAATEGAWTGCTLADVRPKCEAFVMSDMGGDEPGTVVWWRSTRLA